MPRHPAILTAALALTVLAPTLAGCGGSAPSSPGAAVTEVCKDADRLSVEAADTNVSSSQIESTNGDLIGALGPLDAGGQATPAQQMLGTDALSLSNAVNAIFLHSSDPSRAGTAGDLITQVQSECATLGAQPAG